MQGANLYLGQSILYFLQVFYLEFYQDSTFRLFWAGVLKIWFRKSIESYPGSALMHRLWEWSLLDAAQAPERQMWAETTIWCLISDHTWLSFTNVNFINFSNIFFARWIIGSFDIPFKFIFFSLPVFSQPMCSKKLSLLGMLSLLLHFEQLTCPAASHTARKGKLASAFLSFTLCCLLETVRRISSFKRADC